MNKWPGQKETALPARARRLPASPFSAGHRGPPSRRVTPGRACTLSGRGRERPAPYLLCSEEAPGLLGGLTNHPRGPLRSHGGGSPPGPTTPSWPGVQDLGTSLCPPGVLSAHVDPVCGALSLASPSRVLAARPPSRPPGSASVSPLWGVISGRTQGMKRRHLPDTRHGREGAHSHTSARPIWSDKENIFGLCVSA